MTIVNPDILDWVKSVTDTDWTAANTNTRTPTVQNIFITKRLDLRMEGDKDFILLYEISNEVTDNATGAASKEVTRVIRCDIRTLFSRKHVANMLDELERIWNNRQTDPFNGVANSDFHDISDVGTVTDLSDKLTTLFRVTLDLTFKQLNIAV